MIFSNFYKSISETTKLKLIKIIEKAYYEAFLSASDLLYLMDNINEEILPYMQSLAYQKAREVYGDSVFVRGLIEVTNECYNDCYYCGLRKSNEAVSRYSYDAQTIKEIIDHGYQKGYRTFVLQGGEDIEFDDELIADVIKYSKEKYKDIAITLSLGIKEKESYQYYKDVGASRYLLRHESASETLFSSIHPKGMKMDRRLESIRELKRIGYQTGTGFMVGLPNQNNEDLVKDFMFIQEIQPEMIGLGPFLASSDTPFADKNNADLNHVLICYALARLLIPHALIPSTTATSSLSSVGRLKALESGCNVIMINISLEDTRAKYKLYENKTYLGDESQKYVKLIEEDINKAGLKIDFSIGNHK